MENQNLSGYWQGGPFQVAIILPASMSQYSADKAIEILETFRDYCQQQYIAFFFTQLGSDHVRNKFKEISEQQNNENTKVSVGSQVPNLEQSPGQSTIAQMDLADILEGLKTRGEFENQHANALVVFIYHLWDDNFRKKIAASLSIPTKKVTCDLMGDIRKIRNKIIHHQSVIPQNLPNSLKILSRIWDIKPGKLLVSSDMIRSLMEQINALRITILEDEQESKEGEPHG